MENVLKLVGVEDIPEKTLLMCEILLWSWMAAMVYAGVFRDLTRGLPSITRGTVWSL